MLYRLCYLLTFLRFFGPSAYKLNYWGDTDRKTAWRRKKVLDTIDHYFFTLVQLKLLNLHVVDLANRTGILASFVLIFITWVRFMYQYLKGINWTPSKLLEHSHVHAFQER